MDRERGSILFVLFVITALIGVGGLLGSSVERRKWQREAVDSGHAEFDSKTTEFKWLELK